MPVALTTALTELPESRVRLSVEVPAGEVESSVERRARELARTLRLPGFRRGKVPPRLVIQRVGRETILEEAVRAQLPSWYASALQSSRIVPIGDPSVDLGELPAQGEPLRFSVEIGVLPKAELGPYKGLEVGRREPVVEEERVEREVESLRERLARLETAERAAEAGDFVVIDVVGSLLEEEDAELEDAAQAALNGRDQLVELGSGRLAPELETALTGASAGEQHTVELTFPAEQGAPLAGRQAQLELTVREVKRKELPALDDDLAIDAGFDDLNELRDDIRARIAEAEQKAVEAEFREAALDAAVAEATVPTPPALVKARAQEMWERMVHSLSHRGMSRETYLSVVGRSEAEQLMELEPDAEQALKREAVLTAIVSAEAIEPGEDALGQALAPIAQEREISVDELLSQLRASGRLDELGEELAARSAIDLIAEHAKPIPLERAKAREQIWTPEREERERGAAERGREQGAGELAGGPGRLWTPSR
jgi:trigger factor